MTYKIEEQDGYELLGYNSFQSYEDADDWLEVLLCSDYDEYRQEFHISEVHHE